MYIIYIAAAIFSSLIASVSANFTEIFVKNITFQPPFLSALKDGTSRDVRILLAVESSSIEAPNFALKYESEDPMVAWASGGENEEYNLVEIPQNFTDDPKDLSEPKTFYFNTTFTVSGKFLGKTKIHVKMLSNETAGKNSTTKSHPYSVWVIGDNQKMQHIFIAILSLLLIAANVLMGAQLNLSIVVEVLKKPLAPAIGFCCQYLFMPLASYGLARILFSAGYSTLGLGLFTTGCCPGGGASNGYTVLFDGNIDLSITMTFVSTVAALVMMPMWMFALGNHFLIDLPGLQINIPYKRICYTLLMLVLPLLAGVLLRRFRSKWADKTKSVLRPFLLFIIVFICTFGAYVNFYMFRLMTWRVLLGGLALPWMGFIFGTLVAGLFHLSRPNLIAVAIETGIQNTGIGIILLQLSFPQPDADLAAVVPVVVAIFTPAPLLIALAVNYIMKWRMEKEKQKEIQLDMDLEEEKVQLDLDNNENLMKVGSEKV